MSPEVRAFTSIVAWSWLVSGVLMLLFQLSRAIYFYGNNRDVLYRIEGKAIPNFNLLRWLVISVFSAIWVYVS